MNKRNLPRRAAIAAAAFVAALASGAALYAVTNMYTPVLNLPVDYPQIWFNGAFQSTILYDADSNVLKVDAGAFAFVDPITYGNREIWAQGATPVDGSFPTAPGFPPQFTSAGTFKIRMVVDEHGKLVPGSGNDACGDGGGDDVCVIGDVKTVIRNQPIDDTILSHQTIIGGVLLRGKVVDFASTNDRAQSPEFYCQDPVCDDFVFHIKVTGGELQSMGLIPTNHFVAWDFSPTSFGVNGQEAFTGSFTSNFGVVAKGDAGPTTIFVNPLPPPDTTPPVLVFDPEGYDAPATSAAGAIVNLPVTATDDKPGAVVTCDPASGSIFRIGATRVRCFATDAAGNRSLVDAIFDVRVFVAPPSLPGGGCFVIDFREVTYFKDQNVIVTWPYSPAGGPGTTKSRGTKYRIYGFNPGEIGHKVPNADFPWIEYTVTNDPDVSGAYIDLNGPARAAICANQLANYVLAGNKGNGHMDGSTLLPALLRNVPGIILSHNTQLVKLPTRVRTELKLLGLPGGLEPRGLIDYIGIQQQGNGDAHFREFVDVRVEFLGDSVADRLQHHKFGFHTLLNVNFESFVGCNYVDYAPGNDGVRLRDVWGPNRSRNQSYASWQPCGPREPAVNKRQRENYEVPFNAAQILSTVNVGNDTLSMFYGEIKPIPAKEKTKKDHKLDWAEWDRWDR